MSLDLTDQQRAVVTRVAVLAREKFAPRADRHDRTATFPADDFDDLFRERLHAAAVPGEYGGLGLGPLHGDLLTLWLMTKELAKADLSLARCWEGHVNSVVLIDGLASREQKVRWFEGIVERGDVWVAWSGEPQAVVPGDKERVGTTTERVAGGFVVTGTKVFATSAGGAQWAILLVNTAGPGGARHAAGSPETLLLAACDLSDSSVAFDASWWDPIGMRATVSHLARFERTFIPDDHIIGQPGQYLTEGWQTCFIPHYAASFLGAAEASYELALDYVSNQDKAQDPYVAQHVGQMAISIDTAHLWLQHVAHLWDTGRLVQARTAGIRARYLIEHLAEDTVRRCIRACGARSLNRPNPLERIYRDLSFYVRHDNADHILATVGKSVLGRPHDPSFFKP